MKCRVSEDELRQDLHSMQLTSDYEKAEDKALKLLNTEMYDSETVFSALDSLFPEDWGIFLEQLHNDPCAAGIKLKQAVYMQLVKECLTDE